MGKHQHNHDEQDIAQEEYKGPGRIAAAAGEGFIAHFQWALIGLAVGTLGAYVFHKPADKLVNGFRNFARNNTTGPLSIFSKISNLVFGTGPNTWHNVADAAKSCHADPDKVKELVNWTHNKEFGFGSFAADHLLHLVPVYGKKWRAQLTNSGERVANALSGGGILAFTGYFILPLFLAGKGFKRANDGKNQFDRARSEILTTREENSMLRHRYADAKLEIEELKTKGKTGPSLRVADDEPQNAPMEQAPVPEPQKTPQAEATPAPDAAMPWGEKVVQNRSAEAQHAAAI